MPMNTNVCKAMVFVSNMTPRVIFPPYRIFQGQLYRAAWASSLSGIHRGLRKSGGEGQWSRKSKTSSSHRNKPNQGGGWNSLNPRADDVQRAISGGDAGESRRMSRRKRFHDPNSTFGKQSMVYRLKYGDLKEEAERLLAEKERLVAAKEQSRPTDTATSNWGGNHGRAEARESKQPREDRDREQSTYTGKSNWGWNNGRAEARESKQPFRRREDRDREQPPDTRKPSWGWKGGRDEGERQPFRRREDRDREYAINRTKPSWGGNRGRGEAEESKQPFWRRDDHRKTPMSIEREAEGNEAGDEPHDGASMERQRGPKKRHHVISLPYTTAASQFLYGKSVAKSALMSSRRKLYKLYILEGETRTPTTDSIWELAASRKLPVHHVNAKDKAILDKMSEGKPHNGYVIEASPLPQLPVTSLRGVVSDSREPSFSVKVARQSKEEEEINGTNDIISYNSPTLLNPLVLFLHEVEDPQNLGALIRSASFLGVGAVAISKTKSAPLSNVALKASAGAAEHMPILIVEDAVAFVEESRKAGWRSFAARGPPDSGYTLGPRIQSLAKIKEQNPLAKDPCIIVVANEGSGIPKALRNTCNVEVFIPGANAKGALDSLNVSVAGGILCNAFLRERSPAESAETHTKQIGEGATEGMEVEQKTDGAEDDRIF